MHQNWDYESKPSTGGWEHVRIEIRLRNHGPGKRLWRFHLALNEQRFARSTEFRRFLEKFPQVAEEFLEHWERRRLEGARASS